MTTRGFGEKEFKQVGKMIAKALKNSDDENVLNEIKKEVILLTDRFPIGG